MPAPTVADEWISFAQAVLPPDCSRVQRIETRRAFYAGCRSMLTMISQIADASPDDDAGTDAGAQRIERLAQELAAFNELVKAGKA